jgi:hypothetical protein
MTQIQQSIDVDVPLSVAYNQEMTKAVRGRDALVTDPSLDRPWGLASAPATRMPQCVAGRATDGPHQVPAT